MTEKDQEKFGDHEHTGLLPQLFESNEISSQSDGTTETEEEYLQSTESYDSVSCTHSDEGASSGKQSITASSSSDDTLKDTKQIIIYDNRGSIQDYSSWRRQSPESSRLCDGKFDSNENPGCCSCLGFCKRKKEGEIQQVPIETDSQDDETEVKTGDKISNDGSFDLQPNMTQDPDCCSCWDFCKRKKEREIQQVPNETNSQDDETEVKTVDKIFNYLAVDSQTNVTQDSDCSPCWDFNGRIKEKGMQQVSKETGSQGDNTEVKKMDTITNERHADSQTNVTLGGKLHVTTAVIAFAIIFSTFLVDKTNLHDMIYTDQVISVFFLIINIFALVFASVFLIKSLNKDCVLKCKIMRETPGVSSFVKFAIVGIFYLSYILYQSFRIKSNSSSTLKMAYIILNIIYFALLLICLMFQGLTSQNPFSSYFYGFLTIGLCTGIDLLYPDLDYHINSFPNETYMRNLTNSSRYDCNFIETTLSPAAFEFILICIAMLYVERDDTKEKGLAIFFCHKCLSAIILCFISIVILLSVVVLVVVLVDNSMNKSIYIIYQLSFRVICCLAGIVICIEFCLILSRKKCEQKITGWEIILMIGCFFSITFHMLSLLALSKESSIPLHNLSVADNCFGIFLAFIQLYLVLTIPNLVLRQRDNAVNCPKWTNFYMFVSFVFGGTTFLLSLSDNIAMSKMLELKSFLLSQYGNMVCNIIIRDLLPISLFFQLLVSKEFLNL